MHLHLESPRSTKIRCRRSLRSSSRALNARLNSKRSRCRCFGYNQASAIYGVSFVFATVRSCLFPVALCYRMSSAKFVYVALRRAWPRRVCTRWTHISKLPVKCSTPLSFSFNPAFSLRLPPSLRL